MADSDLLPAHACHAAFCVEGLHVWRRLAPIFQTPACHCHLFCPGTPTFLAFLLCAWEEGDLGMGRELRL